MFFILLLACATFAQAPRATALTGVSQQAAGIQDPAGAAAVSPADSQAVFRTGVTYVRLDVQAEEDGRIVKGLQAEDFRVFDNGQLQPVAHFDRDSDRLSLILLLDLSGSMKKFLQPMAATALDALRFLRPSDRVSIQVFGVRSTVYEEFSDDIAEVARRLPEAVNADHDLGSGTAINAAVVSAAQYMKEQAGASASGGRRAILIVTDNLGLNHLVPDEDVIRALYESETVLNAIVVGRGRRPGPTLPGRPTNPDFTPADVFRLAEATGGEAVRADRAAQSFAEMLERIRSRYSVLYRAPDARPGEFRNVVVLLSPEARKRYPKLLFRHRAGYFAGNP